jgi:hypothetical protein
VALVPPIAAGYSPRAIRAAIEETHDSDGLLVSLSAALARLRQPARAT